MFDNLPTRFNVDVSGNSQKPVEIKISIGPNILYLGLAGLALLGVYALRKGK